MPREVNLTNAEVRRIDDPDRGLKREKTRKLTPKRQVQAIQHFIERNRHSDGGADLFVPSKDRKLSALIGAIGERHNLWVQSQGFQDALRSVSRSAESQYSDVSGQHGYVPAATVRRICEQYRIQSTAVKSACNRYARAQGQSGVKEVEHRRYIAELKLLPMGNERVFATRKDEHDRFVFEKVAHHL